MSVAVSVQQFSRHFESSSGPIQAVEEASFTIAPGEFVALVGPSGCGKSTMLRAIAGLDTEYTGEIRADDRLIQGPDLSRGIIFQEPRLFPWLTLAQNVGFGLRLAPSQRTERVSQLRAALSAPAVGGHGTTCSNCTSAGTESKGIIAG